MTIGSFGRSALRVTKNYGKGYSSTQIKARNATCNDPWPPSGKEMYELAQMTYNQCVPIYPFVCSLVRYCVRAGPTLLTSWR